MKALCCCILLLLCCSPKNGAIEKEKLKEEYFKTVFIKKFKVLQLPLEICEGKRISNNFPITNPDTLDSLFTESGTLRCYGMLADTTKFYTVIFYAPAVTYVPVLSTFDKKGNRIYDQGIDFGCWDGGPGEYDCNGYLRIDSSLNLDLRHTVTCYDCGSTLSSPKKYFKSGKGKIKQDGRIELITESKCDSIYKHVDELPTFRNGYSDLYKYVSQRVHFKPECLNNVGIEMMMDLVIDEEEMLFPLNYRT